MAEDMFADIAGWEYWGQGWYFGISSVSFQKLEVIHKMGHPGALLSETWPLYTVQKYGEMAQWI